jgi:chromosome segregation ATPase
MRSGSFSRALPLGVLLLLVGAAPLLTGCSTLGIAEVKNVDAKNQQQDSQINGVDQRVQSTEAAIQQIAQQQQAYSARIDSLDANVTQMRTWLASLNVDTIAQDAQRATALAEEAEGRTRSIISHYLARLQKELTALEAEIAAAQQQLDASGTSSSSESSGVNITTTDDSGDGGTDGSN